MPIPLKTCAAVVTAAILGLAACGDDDEPDAQPVADDTETEADTEAAGTDGDGDGDTEAYCAASLAMETAPPPDVDFATASPEELAEALKAHATQLRPLADDILTHAPDELSDEFEVLDTGLDEMAATGADIWEDPEAIAAATAAHAYDVEHCGWEVVEVAASDYAFDGLPDELPAGETSFELSNDADEVHELVLLRKNDGVTQSAEELLALPEEEAMALAEMVGSPAFAAPGEAAYTVKDLEPGDYIAACFVPTGMTDLDGPPPEGPPHAMNGMVVDFTVTG